ncbi:hypothetical protein [Wenzhouxiangella sp. EGI_FJ10409]|uniref:hypothetical protein n=1 Tax=Wenzhouxiangella sp. EGI_FJ10409 TaxID=3243767 RepID=UPI0035DF5503
MSLFRSIALTTLLLGPVQASDEDDYQPSLLSSTHQVVDAAGLERLEDQNLPAQESELRVWIGFGVGIPDHMLRLHANGDKDIRGEILAYFPSALAYMGDDAEHFRGEISQKCNNFRVGDDSEVCTASFDDEPGWDQIYHKLVDLGIRTLPDESELPDPKVRVHDGVAMVVELRTGSRYRAYQYANPGFRDQPEAQAAARIMRVIFTFLREAGVT